jgi:hypothetical protein
MEIEAKLQVLGLVLPAAPRIRGVRMIGTISWKRECATSFGLVVIRMFRMRARARNPGARD